MLNLKSNTMNSALKLVNENFKHNPLAVSDFLSNMDISKISILLKTHQDAIKSLGNGDTETKEYHNEIIRQCKFVTSQYMTALEELFKEQQAEKNQSKMTVVKNETPGDKTPAKVETKVEQTVPQKTETKVETKVEPKITDAENAEIVYKKYYGEKAEPISSFCTSQHKNQESDVLDQEEIDALKAFGQKYKGIYKSSKEDANVLSALFFSGRDYRPEDIEEWLSKVRERNINKVQHNFILFSSTKNVDPLAETNFATFQDVMAHVGNMKNNGHLKKVENEDAFRNWFLTSVKNNTPNNIHNYDVIEKYKKDGDIAKLDETILSIYNKTFSSWIGSELGNKSDNKDLQPNKEFDKTTKTPEKTTSNPDTSDPKETVRSDDKGVVSNEQQSKQTVVPNSNASEDKRSAFDALIKNVVSGYDHVKGKFNQLLYKVTKEAKKAKLDEFTVDHNSLKTVVVEELKSQNKDSILDAEKELAKAIGKPVQPKIDEKKTESVKTLNDKLGEQKKDENQTVEKVEVEENPTTGDTKGDGGEANTQFQKSDVFESLSQAVKDRLVGITTLKDLAQHLRDNEYDNPVNIAAYCIHGKTDEKDRIQDKESKGWSFQDITKFVQTTLVEAVAPKNEKPESSAPIQNEAVSNVSTETPAISDSQSQGDSGSITQEKVEGDQNSEFSTKDIPTELYNVLVDPKTTKKPLIKAMKEFSKLPQYEKDITKAVEDLVTILSRSQSDAAIKIVKKSNVKASLLAHLNK